MKPLNFIKGALISNGNVMVIVMLTGCLTTWKIADSTDFSDGKNPENISEFRDDCNIRSYGAYNDAELFHYDCSHVTYGNEPIVLSESFSIPPELQRRVNFWKTVYTKLSVRDYAIHLRDHPEVVLEVIRFPWLDENGKKDRKARQIIKDRKAYYAGLLKQIHRQGHTMEEHDSRIKGLMQHLSGDRKFVKSVGAIRAQKGQKEFILRGLEMSSGYLSHIEAEFEEASVPKDLAKIAFVESSFNLRAVSKVGASGVYQLMPFVAKKYMHVNDRIDERRDPLKAGIAAAQVLKTNYKILGQWPLAITAYNHGPYGIKRAVNKAGSDDIVYLINNYEGRNFGFASKNFYTQFLTMLQIVDRGQIYFPEATLNQPIQFRPVTLDRPTRTAEIKKQYDIDTATLHELNPDISKSHLRRNGRLPRGYVIKLPAIDRISDASSDNAEKSNIEQINDRITN